MPRTFEERLTAVEERMDMESGLRASIDRDLSRLELGQQTALNLIQAVALTQSEHTRDLDRHTELLWEHTGMLKELGSRLDRMDDRFDRMDDRFDRIDDRFDRMDDRFAEVIGMLKARES